ncbi:flagellar biosynthesis protein FlhB [Bacillus luteolus]|uniref:Flagellar biosynthetic protein FlhB n=1 Tax=Litchfieldia luteola TaxID=682179 RepID=A0ABR9QJN8_9BACI|nr:flagellar biosynthesis protein FlhB [Cytobacillus luteolus]MBE4908713.1 flagellar biosynthesis protein FlhB [Cytobacillus luteolus]MBP1941572.1 flagellar biosynthetic protein FlhB [Cytobacillus luteolus]
MNLVRLDLQFFAGEKTEKATPKKRQDSRKKGQVAKSQDVNTAFLLIAIFLLLLFIGGFLKDITLNIFRHSFQEYMLMDVSISTVHKIFLDLLLETVIIVGPIMAVALLAGVGANLMQVGFLFSTESIQMKLSKIDPIQGFKRIYSVRALVEMIKSILKILFIGAVTFFVIYLNIEQILKLSQITLGNSLAFLGKLTIQMGLAAAFVLLLLSVLDYFYQKYDYEKNIRMSKQDIKDEYKKSEGDPLIKSKIKQKQREMAMQRMMQEVPKADVVITNPTHYAIALKYDENKMDAPYVVAKGVDFVAQKIKEIANENDIIMVENRPLARALYSQTEIGDAVPEDFFKAVAEILAYVYRLKQKV